MQTIKLLNRIANRLFGTFCQLDSEAHKAAWLIVEELMDTETAELQKQGIIAAMVLTPGPRK